jgi:hypothetical protein
MNKITVAALAVCLFPAACSSDGPKPAPDTEPGIPIVGDMPMSPDLLGGPDNDGDASGGASGSSGDGEPSCSVSSSDETCAGQVYQGESIPLDIYIMFDQSGSMCSCTDTTASQICPNPECAETRLDAVRSATERFLLDPGSAGIGVGLGYFGKQPIGQASCEVADYAAPAVTVGMLPDHAGSLMQALNELEPVGETPTGAAIRGACGYARSWKEATPGHKTVILLLTDGKPEAPATCQNGAGACCPSLSDAVSAAEQCRTQDGIETYVLGVGPLLENLAQIAVAGGTEQAYLVEGGDVSNEVLIALNRIRGDAAIPCQLQLPPAPDGLYLDLDQVNLEYRSVSCGRTLLYSVPSAAECGDEDGWYYDNAENPSSIELCPESCDRVSGPGGSLLFSVGCDRQFRIY